MNKIKYGFTLVELLVVLVIISILLGLLLPAVQQIREAARRGVCENNMKQLALACINHEHNVGTFPSGGWGPSFVGDPDMGTGKNQPGAWLFSILPYLEQNDNYMLATDGDKATITTTQKEGAVKTVTTPMAAFLCPSRRTPGEQLPILNGAAFINSNNVPQPYSVCKSDYAANSGSVKGTNSYQSGTYILDSNPRVNTNIAGTEPSSWNPVWDSSNDNVIDKSDGIMHRRSSVCMDDIIDGTSKTYLLGEKTVCPNFYLTVQDTFVPLTESSEGTYTAIGDQRCAYSGCNDNNHRSAGVEPQQDTARKRLYGTITVTKTVYNSSTPTITTERYTGEYSPFGSAHSGAFGMAFCDGSVHRISYGINASVHSALGTRNGSEPVDLTEVIKK